MSSFLANYIETQNPVFEDVLLDSELLGELKFDQGILKEYIINNLHLLVDYLVIEPDVNSSSKRNFNLPFKACEVLCGFNSSVAKYVLDHEEIFFDRFFWYVTNTDKSTLLQSTLPGYGFKIINKYIKSNSDSFSNLLSNSEFKSKFYSTLTDCLYLDSAADSILLIITSKSEYEATSIEFLERLIKYFDTQLKQVLELILKSSLQELDQLLALDSLINTINIIMKLLKVLNLIEEKETAREDVIGKLLSVEIIDTIFDFIKEISDSNANGKYKSVIEVRLVVHSLLKLITSSAINLMNIHEFNKEKLQDYLSLFIFDEVLELDLIPEKKETGVHAFFNNLILSQSFSEQTIQRLVSKLLTQFFSSSTAFMKELNERAIDSICKNVIIVPAGKAILLSLDFIIIALSTSNVDLGDNEVISRMLFDALSIFFLYESNNPLISKIYKIVQLLFSNQSLKDLKQKLCSTELFLAFLERYERINLTINPQQETYCSAGFKTVASAHLYSIASIIMSNIADFEANQNVNEKIKSLSEYHELFTRVSNKRLTQDRQNLSDLPEDKGEEEGVKADSKNFKIIFHFRLYSVR